MRIIGSLIKYLIYLSIVLIAAGSALFWFDTGSWLVLPIAQRAGNFFLDPMKLEIQNIEGSIRNGYRITGLNLISDDKNLFTLDYASVSPDWDLVLSGMDGLPFIKSLNIDGITTNLDNIMALVNHFSSSEDTQENEESNTEPENETSSQIHLNPFDLSVKNIFFGTPYINLSLDKLLLDNNGKFTLNANLLSQDNSLPIKTNARINFEPIEIISSDLFIGQKGTGKLTAKLEPLKANLYLTALSLDEFMKLAPDLGIKVSGRIDSRVSALSEDGKIKASGILSVPRANVMDIPLNFRLPFNWDGEKIFAIDNANLNTKAASLNLNADTDISTMRIKADGQAQNISLNEIGQMFAPEAKLYGEGGNIKFNADVNLSGDILNTSKLDFTASIPEITAAGIRILRGLSAHLNLTPGDAPKISMNGEIFKGKLFARAEADYNSQGNIKPSAIISLVNLDIPTLINSVPSAAKSVQKPVGKISARTIISQNFDVEGRITSDKLGAYGAAVTNLLADFNYKYNANTAALDNLSMNFGKGTIKANGEANINNGKFNFSANANNIEPRILSILKDLTGIYSLNANASGNYNNLEKINVDANLSAKNAGYSGITIGNINIPVNMSNNLVNIPNAQISLPKGKINLNGTLNLSDSRFNFTADANNVEPRYIKVLKDLSGVYNLKAQASGIYTNINSINANADLTARNVGYSGITIGNINLPVKFSNNIINIPNAKASLPGGTLNLNGSVNIKNTNNPYIDLTASTQNINLAEVMTKFGLQDENIPVSGRFWGTTKIKGPLNKADVNAVLRVNNVKAGTLANIPNGAIDIQGNTQKINLNNLEATINDAVIKGRGNMTVNQKNIMNSKINFNAGVVNLDLKKILTQFTGSAPVEGIIRANASVNGTISQPSLNLDLKSPVIYQDKKINDISVKLNSPQENHYVINTSARINDFKPEADIDLTNKNGIWNYKVDTNQLDIDKAVQTQMPDLAGMAKGFLKVSVNGSTNPNSDINVKAESKKITVLDKIDIQDLSVPVKYMQSKNKAVINQASVKISDGIIKSGFEYDINKSSWNGNVKVMHLDFGKIANKFLPEGELIGSIDVEVNAKGQNGSVFSTSYANGKFKTSPGYFHKMAVLENITPTKKITFENISGTFFWNGKDLFLNPGTGARAGYDEPLYRYVTVNGSLGVPGKGLNLLCDGRFDLKILDQLLGAMKGVFQYMTGSLGRDVLKDAAGRILGVKRKDFQNVSFTLANSWDKLQLLNLKITKPIEDFLPIDILNKDQEKQKDDTDILIEELGINLTRLLIGGFETDELDKDEKVKWNEKDTLSEKLKEYCDKKEQATQRRDEIPELIAEKKSLANVLQAAIETMQKEIEEYKTAVERIQRYYDQYGYEFGKRSSGAIEKYLCGEVHELKRKNKEADKQIHQIDGRLRAIENGSLHVFQDAIEYLEDAGVYYQTCESYLLSQIRKKHLTEEEVDSILSNAPVLAFSIIMEEAERKKLDAKRGEWLASVVPLITNEEFERCLRGDSVVNDSFIALYQRKYFKDPESFTTRLRELRTDLSEKIELNNRDLKRLGEIEEEIIEFNNNYPLDWLQNNSEELHIKQEDQIEIEREIESLEEERNKCKERISEIEDKIENGKDRIRNCENWLRNADNLRGYIEVENEYLSKLGELNSERTRLVNESKELEEIIKKVQIDIKKYRDDIDVNKKTLSEMDEALKDIGDVIQEDYLKQDIVDGESWKNLYWQYKNLVANQGKDAEILQEKLKNAKESKKEAESELSAFSDLSENDYKDIIYQRK